MMKNTIIAYIFGGIACLELSAEVLTIGNASWEPFQGEQYKNGGILAHIVTEAFAVEGIDVDHRWAPWKRVLTYAKSGRWDAANSVGKSKERDPFLLYTDAIISNEIYLFHLKSKPLEFNHMSDLSGKIVGVMRGYYYGERFKNAVDSQQISTEEVSHQKQNFKKLLAGRIHLVIVSKEVALNVLKEQFTQRELNSITFHPVPIQSFVLYLGISKKLERSQQLINSFNHGLTALKKSGNLDLMWRDFERGAYTLEK